MKLTFDRDLLEAAYLLLGPKADPAREAIYEIADERRREEAFEAHVAAWFRDSGIESRFREVIQDYPLLLKACPAAIIRRVRNPADEMAELFRDERGINRIGIGMRSDRVGDGSFVAFLRHELCHIHDMLDPAFGYPGPATDSGAPDVRMRADRYGLLWDVTIDARLVRRFESSAEFRQALDRHRVRFESVFQFWPESERAAVFEELSHLEAPAHSRLWDIATDPRRVRSGIGTIADGGKCPICGFTTFKWAENVAIERAALAIGAEFPDWDRDAGCCARCAEIYAAFDPSRVPATVLLPNRRRGG